MKRLSRGRVRGSGLGRVAVSGLVLSVVLAAARTADGQGPGQGAGPKSVAARATASTTLVFDRVTVVDIERGRLVPDQRVVIAGNKIRTMGRSAKISMPRGAQVIDARGQYLIPGLWDLHVHPGFAVNRAFPLLLANGITGFRDGYNFSLDSVQKWRREVWAGTRIGPPRQILSSVPLYGESMHLFPGTFYITGPVRAQQLVDSLKAAGVDMLKTYRLGSRHLYLALAAAARRAGLPFGGHVSAGTLTAQEAAEAGASIIDHAVDPADGDGGDMRAPCLWSTATVATCRPVVEAFKRHGTWWVPTFVVNNTHQLNQYYKVPFHPVTDTIGVHARAFQPFKGDSMLHRYPIDSTAIAALRTRQAGRSGVLRLARELGLPLLAGTDANPGTFWIPSVPFGFGLHVELAMYVAEGLTPLEALRTATLNPAKWLHATDSLGTVTPGKLADLVLLEADPLADITNTQRIRAVVANGRYFDRLALDTLLWEGNRAPWPPEPEYSRAMESAVLPPVHLRP